MFIIKIPLQFLKCIGGSDDLWSFVRFGNYMWQQWYRLRLPLASATVECTSAVRWTISPLIEGRAFSNLMSVRLFSFARVRSANDAYISQLVF
jgi:hypothetical protein